jgi:mannose-binding lectin
MILFAQTTGNHSTNSGSWTPIPGLSLQLAKVVGESALLILNVPNPYATGSNFPGGNFGIEINGQVQSAFAAFTYNQQAPGSYGRVPTTLCVPIQLTSPQPVTATAVWSGIRGSTVNIDSPATLTMVI